jgi:hypothetical protein
MQLQPELREPLAKLCQEPLRILLILEPINEVVRLCRPPDYADHGGTWELSDDGKDPRYHRKSAQAEDLGLAFALAALRIVQQRHPDYRFEVVDTDVALEAGWALRGSEVKARENTRLRPDYFLAQVFRATSKLEVTVFR